jgi:hypothetical protein
MGGSSSDEPSTVVPADTSQSALKLTLPALRLRRTPWLDNSLSSSEVAEVSSSGSLSETSCAGVEALNELDVVSRLLKGPAAGDPNRAR